MASADTADAAWRAPAAMASPDVAEWRAPPPPAAGPVSTRFAAAFALGNFLNEATASLWFTYLIFYLERVQGLTGTQAGFVILAGQLADAFSTPLIGTLSDRSRGCAALGLGRRHAFYVAGSAIVLASFTFVFGVCLPCLLGGGQSANERFASFAAAAAIFNVGWAAAHNAGQSLVPELTAREECRLLLNSARS